MLLFGVVGVHMFIKGKGPARVSEDNFEPLGCALVTLTAKPHAVVGELIAVTGRVTGYDLDCLCQKVEECCDPKGLCTNCTGQPVNSWCCYNDPTCAGSRRDQHSEAAATPGVTPLAVAGANSLTARTQPCDGNYFATFGCIYLHLEISGNAEWIAKGFGCDDCVGPAKEGLHKQSVRTTALQGRDFQTDPDGVALGVLRATAPGSIVVRATQLAGEDLVITNPPVTITVTPVTTLRLKPAKLRRRCGEPATITAVARDDIGAPVANATVTFFAEGDCNPYNPYQVRTTDSNGHATFTFGADEPGAASVVATAVGADGVPVLSDVSHVYFVERQHGDEWERQRDSYGFQEKKESYRWDIGPAA